VCKDKIALRKEKKYEALKKLPQFVPVTKTPTLLIHMQLIPVRWKG
jgi:hypothetical protein